jgi:hypothetical protein
LPVDIFLWDTSVQIGNDIWLRDTISGLPDLSWAPITPSFIARLRPAAFQAINIASPLVTVVTGPVSVYIPTFRPRRR